MADVSPATWRMSDVVSSAPETTSAGAAPDGWDTGHVTVRERQVGRLLVEAACPLRPGEPCTLCHPDANTGPQDCPTVAIVLDDDDLRKELGRRRSQYAMTQRRRRTTSVS